MKFLDKYQAVEVERNPGEDGLERAKRKLIAALIRQIEHANNPGQLNGRGKPIRDWSFRDQAGNLFSHIRFGTRPMKFPTGKAFRIASPEALIPFYSDVIAAVEAGEFDALIDDARKIGARGHGRRHGGGRGGHQRKGGRHGPRD
jgi:hypothetical protein